MRSLDFVSIKLTLVLIPGILLGLYVQLGPMLPFMSFLIVLSLLYFLRNRRQKNDGPIFEIAVILGTFLLGLFVMELAQNPPHHYTQFDDGGKKTWHLKIRDKPKPNPYSQNYIVEVISLENQKGSGKLLLNTRPDSTIKDFSIDDELLVYAKASQIQGPMNPHQFDYRDYLKKQGIQHQLKIEPKSAILLEYPRKTLWGLASKTRKNIIEDLKKQSFGEEELSIMQALLLGQRNDISEITYDNYKNAGAVHILAVSGLHVGILLLLLEFLLAPLARFHRGKQLKLILVVLILWAYAFIAGLSPSVIRAVTMFSFFAYALYLNRPTNSFNIIALSMFFILLVRPLMLFQVGFQMSYAAVIAIVWIYPKLQRFWFPNNWLIRKIWQLLSVSVAAQVGVLPISLFYFHQFPSLFFVSNLLIVPFLGLILGAGLIIVALSILDYLPPQLVQAYNWLIGLMNAVVKWVAEQEGFVLKNIPFDGFQLFLAYLLIVALVAVLSHPKWKNIFSLGMAIIGLQIHALWSQRELNQKESLLLLHKSRNTILLHQMGDSLQVHAGDTQGLGRLLENYTTSERVSSTGFTSLKNHYNIDGKSLYIIDSLSMYPNERVLDYLLLTQTPKLHLDRLLDSIKPKMVLADGSNYKSYIKRWKMTCAKKRIPFHYTGEKGAFYFMK